MKTTRLLGAALLATSVFLGACDDDDDEPTGTTNTATVRFVNATNQAVDIGMNGNFSGATNIASANTTTCMTVNTNTPGLSFRQNGQTSTFTPTGLNTLSFERGQTYTVVLTGAPGSQRVVRFADSYQGATATQGGVRVINGTSGNTNYNLYLGSASATRPANSTQTLSQNGFSPFVPINAGNGQVWLTTGSGNAQTDVMLNTSTFNVTANGYQTIVIADPAAGQTALRAIPVQRCGT